MMTENKPTYHIIGAGIAGLMCARFLKKYDPAGRTVIYEANNRPGGRCYSYEDKELGRRLDNATHVVLRGNRMASALTGVHRWPAKTYFWDVEEDTISTKAWKFRRQILKSMCNTQADEVPQKMIKNICWKLFPWSKRQLGVYFSKHDLTQRIINPMLIYADEIKYGHRLEKADIEVGRIAALHFNKGILELDRHDIVIMALDAAAYGKIFKAPKFDFNTIINVHFRTSQEIRLPKLADYMGIAKGLADWVFINDDIISFTISDARMTPEEIEALPERLWKQLDILRDVNSAFLPPHKVIVHQNATIKQDGRNNALRPDDACTTYSNMFLAGDWTMKDLPCSIESAILSACRAVRTILKPADKRMPHLNLPSFKYLGKK